MQVLRASFKIIDKMGKDKSKVKSGMEGRTSRTSRFTTREGFKDGNKRHRRIEGKTEYEKAIEDWHIGIKNNKRNKNE